MKYLLVILLTAAMLPGMSLYEKAFSAYNKGDYAAAEKMFHSLAANKHPQTYYYFALGKIYRHQGEHDKAIKYLKKFIQVHKSEKSRMAAAICLTYEYKTGKHWSPETVIKSAETLVPYTLKQAKEYGFEDEYIRCAANVANNSGYALIKGTNNPKLLRKAIPLFYGSLKLYKDPMVANNLLYTYIRLIQFTVDPKERKECMAVTKNLFKQYSDLKYKGRIKSNKKYFDWLVDKLKV